jgi:predicted ArsR family transcriptional regulator
MITSKLTHIPEKTQEALLLHLKQNGEMTVAELCQVLGITAMAVRRHLGPLQQEGLVESKIVKQSRGRPNYHYMLTDKAKKSLFPSGFQNLASDFLDIVKQEHGHKGVMEFLSQRNNRVAERFKARMVDKNLAERVAEVAKIFSDDGYMTEWEELADGNFIMYQRNCALHELANQYRQICVLEPRLIEQLLGAKVTRQQYILKNDPVCGYLIRPLEP